MVSRGYASLRRRNVRYLPRISQIHSWTRGDLQMVRAAYEKSRGPAKLRSTFKDIAPWGFVAQ